MAPLFRQGSMLYGLMPNRPEREFTPLVGHFSDYWKPQDSAAV